MQARKPNNLNKRRETNEKEQKEKNKKSNIECNTIYNYGFNVDRLILLWIYDCYNIELGKEGKKMFITKKKHNRIIKAKERDITKLNNKLEEVEDLNKRLQDERSKIIDILMYSKVTKENYFITLDKIKSELDVSQTY